MDGSGNNRDESASGRRLAPRERKEKIASILSRSGYASIASLSERLGVSEMTIRRDLDALVQDGVIERAHGGAVAPLAVRSLRMDVTEPAIDERIGRNRVQKMRIGALAASLVQRDQTIAIDIGSTPLILAQALAQTDVRIFTSSLKIGLLLSTGKPRLYMPGGEVRGREPSMVGPMACAALEDYHFDWLFLGASGLAADGLFDYSLEDTEVKKALIARSGRVVALIDSSKFDRVSIVRVCQLDAIDILITDRAPEGVLAHRLAEADVDVRVASASMAASA
ncbi:MAG: DeoR/GlpR family DNA-binding transcription regulator [Nitratireductor sp.]